MNQQILFFLIDPQNDFIDLPPEFCFGNYYPTLPVAGAHQDCLRIANLLDTVGSRFTNIMVSLDTHHATDVAHHVHWEDREGGILPPFTPITYTQVRRGDIRLRRKNVQEDIWNEFMAFLQNLEIQNKVFTLWPVHCVEGTFGHAVHSAVSNALLRWEINASREIDFIRKGERIWTEDYSALSGHPDLIDTLRTYDKVVIAGEAASHCVMETVLDILKLGKNRFNDKIILLTDCMSPVPGFENVTQEFYARLRNWGIELTTSTEMVSRLVNP